ncbi:MAG: L-threonylcarbamoyladenylate synthase [Pyrinomonadaceae bacterium]|jgi:L-threonylcarbamoyladenylate synthase|nr:L-threonylcarbamoyladenylate synthase [Pyrinomonadaceae bacterium]
MILKDDRQARVRAAAVVRAGGLVAFRTDTFYGLGADPFNRDALRSLLALKGREDGKPILVVVGDASEVARFNARGGKLFDRISARHWPGALTLVVSARPELPEELTAGTGTIGVRLPADEAVCEFVRACGGALTATSANRAGEPPARTAGEVARAFTDGLALVVDGGAARSQEPSTVLDVSGSKARLIREGAVSWRELQETIRGVV